MKKLFILSAATVLLFSFGGNESAKPAETTSTEPSAAAPAEAAASADAAKGIGKFTNVEVGATLDTKMADAGNAVYDVKCASCHKLTEERLVGPGWKGVTTRRKPEWIARMILHSGQMVKRDPVAKQLFKELMVEMPAQGVTDEEVGPLVSFLVSHH